MMDVTLRNNLALFAGYKLSLSMDAAYVRAYYPRMSVPTIPTASTFSMSCRCTCATSICF